MLTRRGSTQPVVGRHRDSKWSLGNMGRGCGDGIAGVHHHIVGRRIGVDWSVGKPDWCCSCLGDCRWLNARDGLGLDARGSHCQRHWLLRQWSLRQRHGRVHGSRSKIRLLKRLLPCKLLLNCSCTGKLLLQELLLEKSQLLLLLNLEAGEARHGKAFKEDPLLLTQLSLS